MIFAVYHQNGCGALVIVDPQNRTIARSFGRFVGPLDRKIQLDELMLIDGFDKVGVLTAKIQQTIYTATKFDQSI